MDAFDHVPGWFADATVYHIYPLGFVGAPRQNTGGPVQPRLAALRRWYDHITALGVNTILLGPIFQSSSHGYDTTDYRSIDRRLGDMPLLRQIVDELHGRGMRVLLDGVFNHTGREFFAFRDIRANGRRSRYARWYHIDWKHDSPYGDGFAYHCWHGHASLPTLNVEHPEVREYLFDVARFYPGDVGIDGWRLDAAEDVPPAFWRDVRAACKAVRPDALLLGEVVRGAYHRWLGPGGENTAALDAATHYPLYGAIVDAMNAGRLVRVARQLRRDQARWPPQVLMNFLGNHDVHRVRSHLRTEAHFYPAMILLLALPYVPCLYYGDECGMRGRKRHGDVELRRPMPPVDAKWPDAQRHRCRETARLAALRREHAILRHGRVALVRARRGQLCVVLKGEGQTAIVAVNIDGHAERWSIRLPPGVLEEGMRFEDVLDPHLPPVRVKDGLLTLDPLHACWGRVCVARG